LKIIRFHAFGGPDVLTLEEAPIPEVGPGEVLIRVESASVNYADILRRRNGPYPHPTGLPATPGIEVAGTVAAVGSQVTSVRPGHRVFAVLPGALGGYAQYALARREAVIPIPDGLDSDTACTLVVSGVTALQMLRDVARLQPGESVFVPGAAGGVGTLAVQIAKVLGARTVVAGASTKGRRAHALSLGADYAIDSTSTDWSAEVRRITENRGVDVGLAIAGGAGFSEGLSSLADFGRMVVYGRVGIDPVAFDPLQLHDRNQSVTGYYVGGQFAARPGQAAAALQTLVGLVQSGQVKVEIGHRLPLADAALAHRLIESRQASGKIVLKP
jgi:NADPH2:quinone reductase